MNRVEDLIHLIYFSCVEENFFKLGFIQFLVQTGSNWKVKAVSHFKIPNRPPEGFDTPEGNSKDLEYKVERINYYI